MNKLLSKIGGAVAGLIALGLLLSPLPAHAVLLVPQGGTGIITATAHGVILGNGTGAFNVTTAGSAGQVLTSNGASSDPTFQTPAASGAAFPFTPTTNFGATANATSTAIWFKSQIQASSTVTVGSGASYVSINSSGDLLVMGSTTLQSFTARNSTTTNATTTSFAITGLSQVPLYVSSTGQVKSAGSGTSGNCVQWGANNLLGDAGAACGTGSGTTFGKSWELDGAGQLAPTTTLAVSIPSLLSLNDQTLAYASTTNNTTIFGLLAGGNAATTSPTQTFLTAVGYSAAPKNATGGLRNTAFGYNSLLAVTTGDDNTAVGASSLTLTSVSSKNTVIGSNAGVETGGGNGNIIIGAYASVPSNNGQINIGNVLFGSNAYNTATVSSAPQVSAAIGVGSTSPSAQLSVHARDGSTFTTLFAIGSSTSGATSTLFSVNNTGSTTIGNFGTCSGTNALTTNSSGTISCGAISGTGGSAYPFTPTTISSTLFSATTSPIYIRNDNGLIISYADQSATTTISSNLIEGLPRLDIEGGGTGVTIQDFIQTDDPAVLIGDGGSNMIELTATGGADLQLSGAHGSAPSTFKLSSNSVHFALLDTTVLSADRTFTFPDGAGTFCVLQAGNCNAFPFTPDTNFGALTNSTTTPVFFKNGLQASSSIQLSSTTITTTGNVGIATSSPYATLSLFLPASSTPNMTAFVISSSTHTGAAYSTTTLFSISNTGSTTIGNFGTCGGANGLTTNSGGTIVCGAISGLANSALTNSTISGVALGGTLASHSVGTDFTGTAYNGSAAVSDWALNMATAHAWTGGQTFVNATATAMTIGSTTLTGNLYFANATGTALYINGSTTIGAGGALGLTVSGSGTTTSNLSAAGDQFRVNVSGAISKIGNGSVNYTSTALQGGSSGGSFTVQNNVSTLGSSLKLSTTPVASADTSPNDAITFFVGTLEKGRINGLGYLGLGTTSPNAIIDIVTQPAATGASTTLFRIASTTVGATTTIFQINNVGVASTTNLIISGLGGSATQCLHISTTGALTGTGSDCGSSGGITVLGNFASTTGTAISLSTTTLVLNGQTIGITIAPSANGIMFTPTLSGTLTNAGLANSTISGIALGSNLASHTVGTDFTGTGYNGSAAVSDWALNMATAHSWTGGQTFVNSTSTSLYSASSTLDKFFATHATTTDLFSASTTLSGNTIMFNASTTSFYSASSTITKDFTQNGTTTNFYSASSTIDKVFSTNGTSTNFASASSTLDKLFSKNASTTFFGLPNLTSGILLTDGNGTVGKYAGASACAANNFITTLSALGGSTCGTAGLNFTYTGNVTGTASANLGGTINITVPFEWTANPAATFFNQASNSTTTQIHFGATGTSLSASSTAQFDVFQVGSTSITSVLNRGLMATSTIWGALTMGTTSNAALGFMSLWASSTIAVVEAKEATSTSQTIDFSTSNQSLLNISTAAITVTFANYGKPGITKRVLVCNLASGTPGAITWPNGSVLIWVGGTAPTATATNNKCDVYSFITTTASSSLNSSGGTTKVFGTATLNF